MCTVTPWAPMAPPWYRKHHFPANFRQPVCVYSRVSLLTSCPTFFTHQTTFCFVVLPGTSAACMPHFSLIQFRLSSSAPVTCTRGSRCPRAFHPSRMKIRFSWTPSSWITSARGITMKSLSGFVLSPFFSTMQPRSTPYPATAAYSRPACSMGVSQKGTVSGSQSRVAWICRCSASIPAASPMI